MANGTYFHDGEGWKPTYERPRLRRPVANYGNSPYYIATDHGISVEAEDNTPALQALIDTISAKGGGVIWFPPGTYSFRKNPIGHTVGPGYIEEYAVQLKSNVSIVGENNETTVLKQVDAEPYAMFFRRGTADDPLTGCCFSNFTVDARSTGEVNKTWGKAFFAQYLRDCVFDVLRLVGTTATALGIDYLDRVYISRITCVDCGRTYEPGYSGSSGIGIGTGGWENENFIISMCECVNDGTGCGQYGIFVENQTYYNWGGSHLYPKGAIIYNCIVRGGLNHGIGVIGGRNITVVGCQSYENTAHGIYVAGKCRNIHIASCNVADNGGCGIGINTDAESEDIVVDGNVCVGNSSYGIRVSAAVDGLCIRDNTTRGNTIGLSVRDGLVLHDCALYNNVCMDGEYIGATFTGNTQYINAQSTTHPSRIELAGTDLAAGIKLMPDGSEAFEADARTTGWLDVRGIDGDIKITGTGSWNGVRIAQYDSDKTSLVTSAPLTPTAPGASPYELTVERLDGCTFIRLFFAQFDVNSPANVQSIVIEGA